MKRHTRLGFAAAAATLTVFASTTALARAPLQKTQAPGFYRLMIGDFEVTAISDGVFPIELGKTLSDTTPARVSELLSAAFLKDPVDLSVNCFLINTGAKLVLIDTGMGAVQGPALGKLQSNLKAAGYEPGQVDEIYITHMHGDHIGGLLVNGKPAFPNAVVRAAQPEADFWLSKPHMDAAAKDRKDSYQTAMNDLNPYVALGKFSTFRGNSELVPGISAVATPGHTPGHTIYVVQSKGETLQLWGDLMHVAAVQFTDPSVTIHFDSDPAAAMAQRKQVFADAAAHGYWVAAAHLSFPGIGHLRATGADYAFVPVNYSVPH